MLFSRMLLLLFPVSPFAQEQVTGVDAVIPAAVPETLKSPRASMKTFLGAMSDIMRGKPDAIDTAISTFELSEVNLLVRDERARDRSGRRATDSRSRRG